MLAEEIATLMSLVPQEEAKVDKAPITGGAFEGVSNAPFGCGVGEGADKGRGEAEWVVEKDKRDYDKLFKTLNPIDGKITGAAAKSEMMKSKLPNSTLGKVWKLSDLDRDGMLDTDEFSLAMHLISIKLEGFELPLELPAHLVPPSKRHIAPASKSSTSLNMSNNSPHGSPPNPVKSTPSYRPSPSPSPYNQEAF